MEGPVGGVMHGSVLSSMIQSQQLQSMRQSSMISSLQGPASLYSSVCEMRSPQAPAANMHSSLTEGRLELMATDMNYSALYLHQLHDRCVNNPLKPYFDEGATPEAGEDQRFRFQQFDHDVTQPRHPKHDMTSGPTSVRHMENILEDSHETGSPEAGAVGGGFPVVSGVSSCSDEHRPLIAKDKTLTELK